MPEEYYSLQGRPLARRMTLLLPEKKIPLVHSLARLPQLIFEFILLFVVITQKEDGNLAAATVPLTMNLADALANWTAFPFSHPPIFLLFVFFEIN